LDTVHLVVERNEEGLRQDAFLLRRLPWCSRADLVRRILRGEVLVDGVPRRKSTRLRAGQRVMVLVRDGPAREPIPRERIPIRVLYEDEHLIVLDKATGTVVHPVGRHVNDTLINVLHLRAREACGRLGAPPRIVHRLDRETSGVIVLAKEDHVRRSLGADFEARRVEKTYWAVVAGQPHPPEGQVAAPIGPDPRSAIRLKMAVRPDGKEAVTAYATVDAAGPWTLLELRPRTGRQHQLRVHCAALGAPILGDHLYGGPPSPSGRLLLHAARLRFRHPVTLEELDLRASAPPEFQGILPPRAGGAG
jgi:23S rRNA pseudouridine1911/1915/1917 synthase